MTADQFPKKHDKLVTISLSGERIPELLNTLGELAAAGAIEIAVSDSPEKQKIDDSIPEKAINHEMTTMLRDGNGKSWAVVTRGDLERFQSEELSERARTKASSNFHHHVLGLAQLNDIFFKVPQDDPWEPAKNIGILASEYDQFIAMLDGPLIKMTPAQSPMLEFYKAFGEALYQTPEEK